MVGGHPVLPPTTLYHPVHSGYTMHTAVQLHPDTLSGSVSGCLCTEPWAQDRDLAWVRALLRFLERRSVTLRMAARAESFCARSAEWTTIG